MSPAERSRLSNALIRLELDRLLFLDGTRERESKCDRRVELNGHVVPPSGDPTPSRADIEMTRLIVDTAKPLGISIHDHIIIGKSSTASMKGLALI